MVRNSTNSPSTRFTWIDQLIKAKGKLEEFGEGQAYRLSSSDFNLIKAQYRSQEIPPEEIDDLAKIGGFQSIKISSSLSKDGYIRVFKDISQEI